MAGRPVQHKADIAALRKVLERSKYLVDVRPIIALTMKYCGSSYTEIGELFGVTRQMAETLVKKAKKL